MILVTGAAGKTGLAVIRALAAKGITVRGLIHQEDYRASVLEAGAEQALLGGLSDGQFVVHLETTYNNVYHIPPNVHPREVDNGDLVILEAC